MPTIAPRLSQPFVLTWRQWLYALANHVSWPEKGYLVSDQHRFIYTPIAKVACTSLKLWFLEVNGEQPARPFNEHVEAERYRMRRRGGIRALQILRDASYFRFAFVRNPWSRVVSAYLNKLLTVNRVSRPVLRQIRRVAAERVTADVSFQEFVAFLARQRDSRKFDEHWRPQHLFLGDNRFDFVGRFENLAEDFAVVQERLQIATPLPHFNPTPYASEWDGSEMVADFRPAQLRRNGALPDYRQFYTPQLRDLVAKIYATDIEQFGYGFDSQSDVRPLWTTSRAAAIRTTGSTKSNSSTVTPAPGWC